MNVRDTLELGRVLIEAGEIETLIDWMEGETRLVYEETGKVLDDPDAAPGGAPPGPACAWADRPDARRAA